MQKTQNFFAFFLRLPSGVTTFDTSPMALPFEKFSFDALNSEQKPSAKNRSIRPVRNRSTGRSTGVDFKIFRSGRENSDRFHLWSETDCQVAVVLTTLFHKEIIGLVLCEVLVPSNSLKTMATDRLYQRIDRYSFVS